MAQVQFFFIMVDYVPWSEPLIRPQSAIMVISLSTTVVDSEKPWYRSQSEIGLGLKLGLRSGLGV